MSNTPAVMVDWLTAIVPIRHKAVDNGVKTHVDGDGVMHIFTHGDHLITFKPIS